ncbi:polysaccharide deacetylase family protein [Verrucomicrobiota bacterium sgz303538]
MTTVHLGAFSVFRPAQNRVVVLTFDDGSRDVIDSALPALCAHGFQATVFLLGDKLGGWNDWDTATGDAPVRLADSVQIREWLSAGQRVGSHGLTHRSLVKMSLSEARREICESKTRMEDMFGVPVEDFCYPYGEVNEAVRDIVAEAGYRTGCSTRLGTNLFSDDPFLLKRVPVQHRRAWMAAIAPGFLARWC